MERPRFFEGVYKDSMEMVGKHYAALARVLMLPLLVILAFEWLLPELGSQWAMYLMIPVYLAATAAFAISIHRVVLLGEDSLPKWGVITDWRRRDMRFLGFYLLISLIVVSIVIPLLLPIPMHGLKITLTLLWVLVALGVASRLSLVLPAIATDQPITLGEAWRRTANHKGLMLAVVIFFPLVLGTFKRALGATSLPELAYVPLLDTLVLLFSVVALSAAYSAIQRYREAGEEIKAPAAAVSGSD